MTLQSEAGHAGVRSSSSLKVVSRPVNVRVDVSAIANLGDESDGAEITAVDPQMHARLIEPAPMTPRPIVRAVGSRPLPPRPRMAPSKKSGLGRVSRPTLPGLDSAALAATMEPEPIHTMEIEVISDGTSEPCKSAWVAPLTSRSTPPPLRTNRGSQKPSDRARIFFAKALFATQVVAWFLFYVTTAMLRWPLHALPHARAFASSLRGNLAKEWDRARIRTVAARQR